MYNVLTDKKFTSDAYLIEAQFCNPGRDFVLVHWRLNFLPTTAAGLQSQCWISLINIHFWPWSTWLL